jgi:hypothetical protein
MYFIKIYTGNKQAPIGSFLNCYLTIFGDKQTSKEIALRNSISHDEKFLKEQVINSIYSFVYRIIFIIVKFFQ